MRDGMVAWETLGWGVRLPASVATALKLLLFLGVLSTGQGTGCSRPASVQHSRWNLTETNRGSLPAGTVVQYSCDAGYALSGDAVITCSALGHWVPSPPHCLKNDVCRPPSEPENGGYMCHPSPCHRLTEGTVIEYFCDEGYTLKGYRYHTCRSGDWDSATPIVCHLGQGKEERSPLAMPALSIVASTASSVALILLLVVLFVLLQPKLKSFHHSRREQGVSGQPASIVVEGVQVSLPSYEEAVYGSSGAAPPPLESRVQIVLSEGPQPDAHPAEPGPSRLEPGPLSTTTASSSSSSSSSSSLSRSHHAETALVHQVPSSSSWTADLAGEASACGSSSESSDQHSLLSLTSTEDYGDDIPLLKEA
ncbi:sushi domain-containing protein 6 [Brachyhypopomus gauderio]|uniref:sushi domain-containing protein 6 n=1 Tax=Brachyhypopomus gauderio TaxID=698409 RepID=UPI004042C07E